VDAAPGAGAAQPPTQPTPKPSLDDPFAGLGDFGDDDDIAALEVPETPAQAQPAQPVPAQPALTAPPQTAQVPTVQQTPTGQQEAMPLPSLAEPGRLAEHLTANEAAITEHLAANAFQLSQADKEAIETDVVGFIPTLLARMYLKSQINMMRQMDRIIPAVTQRFTEVNTRNKANEDKFYSRWPDINAAQHGELVMRLARTYRQMNPNAKLDQMIEELGPIVMMTAKIQPGAYPASNGAGHMPSPMQPRGNRPPAPFTPAVSGGGARPSPHTPAEDLWSGLGGVYQDDE
jgi:hypothetical protein